MNFKKNKKHAIYISLCFFLGIIMGKISGNFRMSVNLRWIYIYGKLLSILLLSASLIYSLVNSIHLFISSKKEWKKNLIWLFISLIPILYFLFTIILIIVLFF